MLRSLPIFGVLTVAVCLSGTTLAAPVLDDVLGPPTVIPPRIERVRYTPPPPLPAADENLDPARLASQPELFARFIEADPNRLDVKNMEPAVALTLTQILLRADRTFLAERLLWQACGQWPERADLRRAHGRVLISLGRPEAALRQLEEGIRQSPGDPSMRYLKGRAIMALPRNAINQQRAASALAAALEIDPNYRDPEGVTADDIRNVLARMRDPQPPPR